MGTGALTVRDDTPLLADDFARAALMSSKAQRLAEVEAVAHSNAPLHRNGPPLGDRSFFERKSVSELAREQGISPIHDIGVLAGGLPDDEDIDEMLEEIYRLREP
jgi:hypothetical protein